MWLGFNMRSCSVLLKAASAIACSNQARTMRSHAAMMLQQMRHRHETRPAEARTLVVHELSATLALK